MLIGKHKMAPVLSPKKSVEGGVGGVLGAALLGALYALLISGVNQADGHNPLMYAVILSLIHILISSIFLLMTDYIYMWTLVKPKAKIWNYIAVILVLASAGAVFFISKMCIRDRSYIMDISKRSCSKMRKGR